MTRTEDVIAGMLVENTGVHMLDSGMAYGRSWQRNQAAVGSSDMTPTEFFKARPEAWQGWKGEEWATVDIFHFLVDRLEYEPATDHAWRLWCYMDPTTSRWDDGHRFLNSSDTLAEFRDALIAKGWAERAEFTGGGYTYNDENALSQDFMWDTFTLTDECPWVEFETEIIAVSIHGGCDARGGFTDYRMFTTGGYEGIYDLLSYADYQVEWQCDRKVDPNQLGLDGLETPTGEHIVSADTRGGYTEWYVDGDNIEPPEELDADEVAPGDEFGCARRCHCGAVLTIRGFYPPYAS